MTFRQWLRVQYAILDRLFESENGSPEAGSLYSWLREAIREKNEAAHEGRF